MKDVGKLCNDNEEALSEIKKTKIRKLYERRNEGIKIRSKTQILSTQERLTTYEIAKEQK